MGSSSSKNTETINWNNIRTENMSSTMPAINSLSKDAKKLIASLNIPAIESETSEFSLNNILDTINKNLNANDRKIFNNEFNRIIQETSNDNNTSPFITSEMYNYLVNSKTSSDMPVMQQGGNHKSSSSSSDFSSDSSLEDLDSSSSSNKKKHDKKHHEKPAKKESESESEPASDLSGGELSYVSSSAHTNGNSDSDEVQKSVSADSNNMVSTSISVNTSDINAISDY
jgi:hypothetical protein